MISFNDLTLARKITMEIKDYSEKKEYTHYNGVSSMYGKIVNEQCREQPKYSEPGPAGQGMHGEHRNVQKGP